MRLFLVLLLTAVATGYTYKCCAEEAPQLGASDSAILSTMAAVPYPSAPLPEAACMQVMRQDWGSLHRRASVIGTPMSIAGEDFDRGIGVHANSIVRIYSPEPIERFRAVVGVDSPALEEGDKVAGSVAFSLRDETGNVLENAGLLRAGEAPKELDVSVPRLHQLVLYAEGGPDGIACDYGDWGNARVTLADGQVLYLDELPLNILPVDPPPYPFSFKVGDAGAASLLPSWKREQHERAGDGFRVTTTTWKDPESGLVVTWELEQFERFPAIESRLFIENVGESDSPVISDARSLDFQVGAPVNASAPYALHATYGGRSKPDDFAPVVHTIRQDNAMRFGGQDRSSDGHFPFFKVDSGDGSIILAVGWSGRWMAHFECADNRHLAMQAGLHRFASYLRPGEKVFLPRIVMLHWPGDSLEANAQFRRLMYEHYIARRGGKAPLPVAFCNTCFINSAGMNLGDLNTAENQSATIRALAPLGIEAVVTDAGWMEGSQGLWWKGCGNWTTPRKDNYPEGIAPVAETAAEVGIDYGLWFEVETVVPNSTIYNEHHEYTFDMTPKDVNPGGSIMMNFGHPEVPRYMADIVSEYFELPGFNFYRQDFGLVSPEHYWNGNEQPGRRGMTEVKHIRGLYKYWELLAERYPDGLREECAAGGRRIDLETAARMHIHQKTDSWFHNEVDQTALWGLSQYLPNCCFVAQLNRLDDYSFHSTLASSLCVGWPVLDGSFDRARAKELVEKYKSVRHLLVGSWYPLTPFSMEPTSWLVSQYHRPDLDEGMLLVFRRSRSPYKTVQVGMKALVPGKEYAFEFDISGDSMRMTGAALMEGLELSLDTPSSSELIRYRAVRAAGSSQ